MLILTIVSFSLLTLFIGFILGYYYGFRNGAKEAFSKFMMSMIPSGMLDGLPPEDDHGGNC